MLNYGLICETASISWHRVCRNQLECFLLQENDISKDTVETLSIAFILQRENKVKTNPALISSPTEKCPKDLSDAKFASWHSVYRVFRNQSECFVAGEWCFKKYRQETVLTFTNGI